MFVVIQTEYQDGEGDMEVDGKESQDEDGEDGEDDEESSQMDVDEEQPQLNPQARLAAKMADETFGPLLRSKGFLWLATRPTMVSASEELSKVPWR